MLIKIKRQDCLENYQVFPLRDYDYEKDEEIFFYPKVFKSYFLTLPSKSFKGHVRLLGTEIVYLTKQLDTQTLIFLGDTELPWLYQDNDYRPAKKAQQYLMNNKIGKRFNGAIEVCRLELPRFIIQLSWLTRCNAALPYVHFTDKEQNIIGHICKYGNLHLDTLHEHTDRLLKATMDKSKFEYLNGNNCFNKFGRTSAIWGRKTVL